MILSGRSAVIWFFFCRIGNQVYIDPFQRYVNVFSYLNHEARVFCPIQYKKMSVTMLFKQVCHQDEIMQRFYFLKPTNAEVLSSCIF